MYNAWKRSAYLKDYWCRCFKDDKLLKKYNDIWNKVSNSIKKEIDCKSIYPSKFFLKSKIKSYGSEDTDFLTREMTEAGSDYICWLLIFIDSVLKKYENYYLQVFLKECKYTEKEKRQLDILLMN